MAMKDDEGKPETTVEVGDEHYVEDCLGNTLAVVVGNEHVWIDVLMANDDASVHANWRQIATLPTTQIRSLISLLSNGLAFLENQNG